MSTASSPSPPLTPPTSDSECDSDINHSSSPDHVMPNPISSPSPHPLAASTKANRSPPAYEKKLFTPPATPPDSKKKIPAQQGPKYKEPNCELRKTSFQRTPSMAETEQQRWDAAVSSAIDRLETKLDLSSANLTYIPPSIIDLNNLVLLTKPDCISDPPMKSRIFSRSTTAPALLPSPHIRTARPFLPSHTMNELVFRGKRQSNQRHRQNRSPCEIELYLMRNAIRVLPRELFALDCLVVLSLRQNKLTSLPPAIGQLTRLRELNIANNRISHLPAEILHLHLSSLHLHPNPFTPPPPREAKQTRSLGPLIRGPLVPTLSELVLRFLLAPSTPATTTRLEAAMTKAEIDTLSLPAHIQRVVRASTGHGRLSEGGMDAVEDMSTTMCPSPEHQHCGTRVRFLEGVNTDKDHDAPVFCTPVEERMEWVGVVAGVQIAENPAAWVPVKWRGCNKGCLAFLERMTQTVEVERPFEVGTGEGGEEFEFSDDE